MKLTQTVQKGGCAAKVPALELRRVLSMVQFPRHQHPVLVDGSLFDDAAVTRLNSQQALVSTLDFFTPVVDSPRIFGRVAAANALSDVFAMGGQAVSALAILAYPTSQFEASLVAEVLNGACDVLSASACDFLGGHSIDDDSLKFGLSVSGLVHPDRIWKNSSSRPGDVLILTKALGTGTLCAGLKAQKWDESAILETLDSMSTPNRVLDLIEGLESSVHAATDITGFGFAGHTLNLARASRVRLTFDFSKMPIFSGVQESLLDRNLTKAHRTNREYVGEQVRWACLQEWQVLSLLDPQTSGGLLLSVADSKAQEILERLRVRFPRAEAVGLVQDLERPEATGEESQSIYLDFQ